MILDVLKSKLVTAQKTKDAERLSVLRYLLAEVKNKEIDLRTTKESLSDEHVLGVIKAQVAQREESIEEYKKGRREDLVSAEAREKEILEELLAELG